MKEKLFARNDCSETRFIEIMENACSRTESQVEIVDDLPLMGMFFSARHFSKNTKIQLKNGIKIMDKNRSINSTHGYVLRQRKFVVRKEHLVKIVVDAIMVIMDVFVQGMEFVM